MLTKTLAATAALILLATTGHALAAQNTRVAATPRQPIPYDQLDAYLKASPKARSSKDWRVGSAMAPTGASSDTAATTHAMPAEPTPEMAVNHSTMSAPPSLPVTPPTPPADPGKANDPMTGHSPATSTPTTEPK